MKMSSAVRRAVLVLLFSLYVAPDLSTPPFSHPSLIVSATSLELKLSSDVRDGADIRLEEEEKRVVGFNYTLSVTGAANHSLALAVCVTVDDPAVAQASVPEDAILPLHQDLQGAFNVTVMGRFVGRAFVHVHFVVGHKNHVRCGEPGAKNLQELLKVSEASRGQEVDMNVTKTSTSRQNSSSSSSSSSSVVGVHSGTRYQVVVLRPESAVDTVFQTGLVILVVIINIGMGCKLDLQVVKATLRRPFAPVTGLCSQFIVMPLLSFAVAQIFSLSPGVSLGFFALGCSPGGSASNVFCYLLGGDVSLSITMTFISTVASIGLLPMWMSTLGRYVSKLDDISIPFANIIYSLLGLVGAVGAGLLLKTKKPAWARIAITITKVAICVFIVFILTVGVYANLYVFRLMTNTVLAAAAFLPYAGFLLGGLVALLLRMPAKSVVTIAIETGIQNTGVAMIVLLLSLDHPESDLSIVAPATSALFTPIPLWIAVFIFKLRRCYRRRKDAAAVPTRGKDDVQNATATTTTADDGNLNSPSSKENLCTKLFGESAPDIDCWRRSCFYCGCDLDKEAPAPRDIEIVIPKPAGADPSPENATANKREPYEFDNPAMENDEGAADSPQSEPSNGTVPWKEMTGISGHVLGPEPSHQQTETVTMDQVLSTAC